MAGEVIPPGCVGILKATELATQQVGPESRDRGGLVLAKHQPLH